MVTQGHQERSILERTDSTVKQPTKNLGTHFAALVPSHFAFTRTVFPKISRSLCMRHEEVLTGAGESVCGVDIVISQHIVAWVISLGDEA